MSTEHKFKTHWYVWLFPLIALGLCGVLMLNYMKERGPMIRLHFDDGSSIQPEKTKIRFRGITIGTVKKITISEDDKEVIAHVQLQKDAEHFAVKGSKFWVVMPNVNFQGISGLETIFEGTYIAATPGKGDAEEELDFKGRIGSENTENLEDTSTYFLEINNADSLNAGDSVTFRGMKVGSVSKVSLNKSSQAVIVQINVQNRFVKLIRTNTVFWKKTAVQANLGLFNSEIKINSLESMLRGGIDFFTPTEAGPMAKALTHFPLNQSPPKDWDKWNPKLEL